MAGIFNLVTKLFGNKYDKDIKSIEPIIKQIHAEHKKITAISNDELRSKTIELKAKIEESVFSEKEEITSLKSKADEKGIDIDEKIAKKFPFKEREYGGAWDTVRRSDGSMVKP